MEEEAVKGGRESASSVIERFPRDFLRRLAGNGCLGERPEAPGGEPEEVELNLGLSLGGCFGADPKGKKKLVRSSSIASLSPLPWEHEFPAVTPTLVRTSSLPTDAEEERRKRKELQSLKRLEAKRKRLEKRNSIKLGAARSDEDVEGGKGSTLPVTIDGRLEAPVGSQFRGVFNVATSPGLLAWAAEPKSTAAQPADVPGCLSQMSQGSVGAQGSSSFSLFESERQMRVQGFNLSVLNSNKNAKNTSKVQSISSHKATRPTTAALTLDAGKPITIVGEEHPLKKVAINGASLGRDILGEMPCVSTRGEGPNGRRIEGFLYKYRKGEEIRIVCVCHGSFLTPAEFVKHAGGGDVAHPLRHIVVNPSPPAFL